MQHNILREAGLHIKRHRRRRIWKKIVQVMACVVVFCTTYALILPAITMEQQTYCGYEEHTHITECYRRLEQTVAFSCSPESLGVHTHSDDCLDDSGNVSCGQADYFAHSHTELCYDTSGMLICSFPEAAVHEHGDDCFAITETEGHVHSEACYTIQQGELLCTTPEGNGHTHQEGCYGSQLFCETAETDGHNHTDSCYETQLTCTSEETEGHSHGDTCHDEEGTLICQIAEQEAHFHDEACNTSVLICGQEEQSAHTHGPECVSQVVVCGLDEAPAHTHGEGCYAEEKILSCGQEETAAEEMETTLICTIPQAQTHTHTDTCMQVEEDNSLTCTLPEDETHIHGTTCYGNWERICLLEEHAHSLQCFSDPEADVETAEVWERTFADVELTGVWADDVIAIAETQIGYMESTRNYTVWEDGTVHGYTRYGDWFGSPHGDWCAMFVSFCLHYADVKDVPLNLDCRSWIEELSKEELDLYRVAEEYTPKPGDIIFFDWEEADGTSDDLSDHVGLVAELIPATEEEPAKLKTIEGNSSNQVKYNTYDMDDPQLLGYGMMPENPDLKSEEETADPVQPASGVYTYSDDAVYVEVQLPENTSVPVDAVLKVSPIEATDDGYSDYVAQAEEAVDGYVANIALYDISFYTADNTYYPVDDTAKVTMGFVESPVDTEANVQVLHFAEEDTLPQILEDVTLEEKEIEIVLEGAQQAELEPTAAVLEKQARFSLFSRTVTEVPAETEPVVETLTETRTVVEFETDGFSTFAVVEVKTGTYVTTVLKTAQIQADVPANLNNRIFVISPGFADNGSNGEYYALTNEYVLVHEYHDYDYHEHERLKAGAVQYLDSITITTPADDGYLWKFIKVDGKANTYYVQSVESGQYLFLGDSRTVKTTPTPNEITVAVVGSTGENGRVSLTGADGQPLSCFYTGTDQMLEDVKVFNARGGGWDEMLLAEYVEESSESNETFTNWQLDGRMFVVSRKLDGNNTAVLTSNEINDSAQNSNTQLLQAVQMTAGLDASGNVAFITLLENTNTAVWKFTAVEGKPNTYHIQSLDGSGYLHLNSNHDLTVEDTPQEIQLYPTNNGNTVAFRNSNGTGYDYVHLYGNNLNRGFGCWGDYNTECYLSLTEYTEPLTLLGGNGGQFVLSIPIANTNTVSVLTSNVITDPHPNSTTPVMEGVAKAADNYGNVDISQIDNTAVWNFIPVAGKQNTYHIQSAATNEYLHIHGTDGNALTTEADPQEIEVVSAGNRMALKLPNTEYYVHWQQFDGDANRGFATWSGLNPVETHLILTKYTPQTEDGVPVVSLDNQMYLICAANTQTGWDRNAIVTDETTQFNNSAGVSRLGLKTVQTTSENGITLSPGGNTAFTSIELNDETADYSRMIWKFIGTDVPGQYYIQAQSAENSGKYIHLDASGITLSDQPQAIEVVTASNNDSWTNAVCLRAADEAGTVHYMNLHGNYSDRPVSTYSDEGIANAGNHFILAQLSEEDMVDVNALTAAIDALPTLEELVTEAQSLLDKNHTNNQRQREVTVAADAAYKAYEALTDAQKYFIDADRLSKLEELKEWLVGDNVKTGRLPNRVPAVTIPGVTLNVFNYTSKITNEQLYKDGFHFFSLLGYDVDGGGSFTGDYINTLNENITFKLNDAGYPVLVDNREGQNGKEIDLTRLFDSTYRQFEFYNGGGLFQQDENGYYYYYSDMNSAVYGTSKGYQGFYLYDTIVRPINIGWSSNDSEDVLMDRRSNFLPFNNLIGESGDGDEYYDTSFILYDSAYHQEEIQQKDMAAKHGLTLSGEQGEYPVASAIINDYTDLWFGLSMEFDFFMPQGGKVNGQDMIFDFHGDDDVWVFIDGVMILDIGGTHAAWDGVINFATGEVNCPRRGNTTLKKLFLEAAGETNQNAESVTINGKVIRFNGDTLADYTAHDLKFFYMERGGSISYCGLKFNLPSLPENSLMVSKEATSPEDQTKDFQFRVVKAVETGTPNEVYFTQGTQFDIMENGVKTGTGTVGENGIFTLKPGQGALFSDILKGITEDPPKLIVQELLGSGNEYSVSYQLGSVGKIESVEKDARYVNTENSIYSSAEIDPSNNFEAVTFYNSPAGSGTLSITKQMAEGHTSEEIFYVRVKMGQETADTLIPVGTKYHIGEQTLRVEEAGIIPLKAGQTATLIGITPGLHYEVAEYLTGGQNYKPTYGVTESNSTGTQRNVNDHAKIIGIVQEGETVAITITNEPYDKTVYLPITKSILPAGVPDNFYFLVDQVESQTNHSEVKEYRPGTLVRVDSDGESDANILLGIEGDGPWYFRVYEEAGTGDYYYDPTFYIVEVKQEGDGDPAITKVWKNGVTEMSNATAGMPFINRKPTRLTVKKTVEDLVNPTNTAGTFHFKVTVKVDNLQDKEHEFDLEHDGTKTISIPYGAQVTVEETNAAGYMTRYQIDSNEKKHGTSASIAEVTDPVTVHFTNRTGYELPKTGGLGTYLYTMGGLMLTMAAAILLYIHIKRGKEDFASS